MKLGIQLYSLKNQIKELGVEPVFKMVSDAGYECVEFAGFYDLPPAEMLGLLKKYGLEGISAHIGLDLIESSLEYIDVIGIKSVYIPGIGYDELKGNLPAVIAKINKIKPELDRRGVVFGYHNHAHEYKEGNDFVYDLIMGVDGFYSEIDTFWVKVAGIDPVEKMKQYGDKLKCLHIKELANGSKSANDFPNPVPGDGCVGIGEVFRLGKQMGIELAVLEVEWFPCDPAEYLKKSYDSMRKFADA